jgi:hypothetical protein
MANPDDINEVLNDWAEDPELNETMPEFDKWPFSPSNPYKRDCKIVFISYKFTDQLIDATRASKTITTYYENNSRGFVNIIPTNFTAVINSTHAAANLKDAQQIAKSQVDAKFGPNAFTFYIHFDNPKISTTGSSQSFTYLRNANFIHETAHLYNISHANTRVYNPDGTFTVKKVRDAFDPCSINAPYGSLNPVHRYSHGWFLPGELVTLVPGTQYNLFMLTNFVNKTNIKTLMYVDSKKNTWFFAYGTTKTGTVIYIHTFTPDYNTSYLDHVYAAKANTVINHGPSGLSIKIDSMTNKNVLVTFNPMTSSAVHTEGLTPE